MFICNSSRAGPFSETPHMGKGSSPVHPDNSASKTRHIAKGRCQAGPFGESKHMGKGHTILVAIDLKNFFTEFKNF
jgi:hypothetical protein